MRCTRKASGLSLTRLSSLVSDLPQHAEIVVVGSGYGGAITASRLARAHRDVVLLEQGRELHPGEFPDTPPEALTNGQLDFGWGEFGNQTGLFDIRMNGDLNVVLGRGLGGTSLVNANVALRADQRVFQQECWPRELRDDIEGLEAGYLHAESMLRPRRLPEAHDDLPKLEALRASATGLGAKVEMLPINVTFEAGPNAAGIHQPACTMCGDCVSGCNVGSKNSLLMNYLPDAVGNGAKVFTKVSVHHLTQRDNRWVLHYQLLDTGQESHSAPGPTMTADVVVLCAGALGSTEILLHSDEVPLSSALGTKFSGNGDVLGFSFNGDRHVDGVGWGERQPGDRDADHPRVGPCITGGVRLRADRPLGEGILIEEGSLPGALAPALLMAFERADQLGGVDTAPGLVDELGESARKLESLLRGPYSGAIRNTMTYLVMADDGAGGKLELDDNGRVTVVWPGIGQEPIFDAIEDNLIAASRPLHSTYVENPLRQLMGGRLTTVHPLGGCPMADDATRGVVNHQGQVFSGSAGSEVHKSLYVSDGAVVPSALGVNPLLTIAALAERTVERIAKDRDWHIDYDSPTPKLPPPAKRAIGIQFSERMVGSMQVHASGEQTPVTAILTIAIEDLQQFLGDPQRLAAVVGTVSAQGLSSEPMTVIDGEFNLLVDDPDHVGVKHMSYRARLNATDGRRLFLSGQKNVRDDKGLDIWSDTTTLHTTIHDGDDDSGPVVARGVLNISAADFARQLRSMRVTGTHSLPEILKAKAQFGKEFGASLFDVYGGVATGLRFADHKAAHRQKRALRAPAPTLHPFITADGLQLMLTRYQGGNKGPVMLTHGLGVSSLIFTIDTIETNLVEYLCKNGYDVWVLDYRVSTALATAVDQYTADDVAILDYPAAVDEVRRATGAPTIQIVAHCYGATTFTMALLAGLTGVRAGVCSQISTHIVAPTINRWKAAARVPTLLGGIGFDTLTTDAHRDEPLWQKAFDVALKFWPVPGGQRCPSAVCHRITFLYGLLYEHQQLNTATHDFGLFEMFGGASIAAFRQLTETIRRGVVVAADGSDRYMPHLDRMALPLTFIHGARNNCFLPASTQKTVAALSGANGARWYNRHLIPNYGHIDCIFGRNAARDVYPKIVAGLEPTATVP